jgi:hypothetical protein
MSGTSQHVIARYFTEKSRRRANGSTLSAQPGLVLNPSVNQIGEIVCLTFVQEKIVRTKIVTKISCSASVSFEKRMRPPLVHCEATSWISWGATILKGGFVCSVVIFPLKALMRGQLWVRCDRTFELRRQLELKGPFARFSSPSNLNSYFAVD